MGRPRKHPIQETVQKPLTSRTKPPEPPAIQAPAQKLKIPVPQEIEAATVLFFDGLWYDLTFKLRGSEIIDKKVGPGDLMRMSIERAVASLVSYAERQRQ